MSFSFSFSGEDIDVDSDGEQQEQKKSIAAPPPPAASSSGTGTGTGTGSNSAFPVAGKPLLPATSHDLKQMLSQLPSKIAYGVLDVDLSGGGVSNGGEGESRMDRIQLPRRELWDVRVQLMAEAEAEAEDESKNGGELGPGLGNHDVRTGIYEGGFKSWESSIDLVKVLRQSSFRTLLSAAAEREAHGSSMRVIELGCGTALPSLALFQWALDSRGSSSSGESSGSWLSFVLADYNPTVLQLVTLPNFILSWALNQQQSGLSVLKDAFAASEGESEGELDLTPEVLEAFVDFLSSRRISLHFFSGAWSPEFVNLVKTAAAPPDATGTGDSKRDTVVIGAETIYSPFALEAFAQTLFALMEDEKARGHSAEALVGAKKLYFGVGGSLDDFVAKANELGTHTEQVWEETEGVRRGVVRCRLS